jgi:hypothetical protein
MARKGSGNRNKGFKKGKGDGHKIINFCLYKGKGTWVPRQLAIVGPF